MPEHPLQFDCFDYAIRNEGEEALVETLEALGEVLPSDDPGWRLAAVRGLIWRRNGEVVINPPRPYMEDLDRLPSPAYDLIPDLTAYHPPAFCYSRSPVLNVHTSRGCPGQCTFCDRSVFGGKFRARSAKAVADDIETLIHRYGAREIAFMDDTFTVSKPRVYEIFRILRERGLTFPWSCMSRISTVDEPLLKFMRDNGCWHIAFGIESGNASVLKVIRKGADLARIEQVIRYCDQIGIKTKGFFMLGHPSDTPESIEQTIEFGVRLPIRDLVVTVNTPWPGTWQFEHAREFGSREAFSFDRWNHWNPVFVPFGLTPEFLLRKHKEFIRRFYFRPRAVWNVLRTPGLLRQLWALAVAYFKHRKTAQSHE